MTILLIDDNAPLLAGAARLLSNAGYTVLQAATGREGLALANSRHPDMMLVDIMLPDTSGYDICRRIKANPALNDIMVLMISGQKISPDEQAAGLDVGADGYIARPVTNRELLARIKAAVRLKAEQDAIRASEQMYRHLIESAVEAIVVIDADGICFANPQAERLSGYARADLLALPLSAIIHPDDRFAALRRRWRCLRGQDLPAASALRILTRQSQVAWIEHTATRIAWQGQPATLHVARDITERKAAEHALHASEARFKAFLDSMPGAVFLKDRQGRVVYCNPLFAALINTTPEHLAGVNTDAYLPAEIQRQYEAENRRVIEEGDSFQSESVFRHHDQDSWWLSYKFPIQAGRERLLGALNLNITDRKQAQRRAQEQTALLDEIMQGVQEGFGVVDEHEVVRFCNPAYAAMFDLTPNELIGKNLLTLFDDDARAAILAQTQDRRAGKTSTYEVPLVTCNGARKWLRVTASPRFDDSGAYAGAFAALLDITPRKQAEEALRESEAKYRALLHTAQEGVFVLQGERVVYANPATLRMIGYTEAELAALNFLEAVYEADHDLVWNNYQRRLRGEQIPPYDFRLRTKQREIVWCSLNAVKIEWNGAAADLVFIQDITDRKQAEDALRESESRFRAVFEQAAVGIGMTDAAGRITEANQKLADMLGYTREELLALTVDDISWPDGREAEIHCVRDVAAGTRDAFTLEKRYRHKDGHPVWGLLYSNVMRDDQGAITSVVGVVVDITDRKHAQAAWRESQEQFQRMFAEAPVGIAFADIDTARFSMVNPAFCRLFGYTEAELQQMTIADISHPDDMPENEDLVHQALRRELPDFQMEKRYRTKSGDMIWANLTGAILHDAAGEPLSRIGFVEDITARKQAELELKEALAEKEVLLQEVHHRVKNNLQTIHGLLYKQRQYLTDEAAKAALSESMHRVHAIALIHEQIYRSPSLAHVNLAQYLRELAEYVFHLYAPRDNRVALRFELEDLCCSLDIAIPLALIVNELLTNALKYAFPDQRAGELTIACRERQGDIILMVRDNGVGLPEDLDIRTDHSLGWYLIYNITARQLGGTVDVQRRDPTEITIRLRHKGEADHEHEDSTG